MITIAIATMSTTLEMTVDKVCKLIALNNCYRFLIVSQDEEYNVIEIKNDKLTIIKSKTVGLSKSRNIAIEYVDSGWIWFQDDDIQLNINEINSIYKTILYYDSDLYFIKIGSLENKNTLYKNYSHYRKHSDLNFLKISSIEIIVSVKFIKNKKIIFDEKLGLGSNLPCCEENKFILDCFNQCPSVFYVDGIACYHTTLISNRNIDYVKCMKARGYLLACLPYWLAILLFVRWSFKFSRISNLSRHACFKLLLDGYVLNMRAR
ncbi:glycosyltransferase [Vibrio cholerae]|uniref:glycosyltransferase n=1 Tax=Vibrio cholerae TaxID=666 RepID=UPI002AB4F6D2|nr:glycosyltransferase [Vibrio cholerae]EKF9603209.1 glycosyltransferase [Vibrio cholerae]MDY7587383.1 glycosyltransferase [Vibrio cholerae]